MANGSGSATFGNPLFLQLTTCFGSDCGDREIIYTMEGPLISISQLFERIFSYT